MTSSKSTLRRQFRTKRNALSIADQSRIATRLLLRYANNAQFKGAKHIAFYWPNDGEPSPLRLVNLAHRLGKACYLPHIEGSQLQFSRYKPGETPLHPNRYGIPEPQHKTDPIPLHDLDVIFLPLVAFDLTGNRLGMGGGYYDRALAPLKKTGLKRPTLLGIAHTHQRLDKGFLPIEDWDYPLDGCLTENYLALF